MWLLTSDMDMQCTDPQCVATMRNILQETLDVLENDLFFAALVPMHRELFINDVIHNAKGSVRSYDFHFPSSYQHYKQMKLVDTRALNGFVVRKGRELSKPAPVNECVSLLSTANDTCIHSSEVVYSSMYLHTRSDGVVVI